MFSVGIKGNHVQSRDRGNRPNHVTKLAVRIQMSRESLEVLLTKTRVTQKPKGVTHQDKSHAKA
jgi:hypothetical protein